MPNLIIHTIIIILVFGFLCWAYLKLINDLKKMSAAIADRIEQINKAEKLQERQTK